MSFNRLIPHVIAIVCMFVATFFLYGPYFSGKVLNQHDNVQAKGSQAEMDKIVKETGTAPLWTQSVFSGMPTYQIRPTDQGNYTKYALRLLMLNQSMLFVPIVIFLAMFCTYLLLITMGLDWRLAVFGGVAYGLSTFMCDIAEAGHSTKMLALGLLPGMYMGAILLWRGKYLLGGALFGLFVALQLLVNHFQISYYGFMALGIFFVIKWVDAFKTKHLKTAAIASAIMIITGILGISSNTSRLWTTYEYSKETIRGKSELTSKSSKGDGLDEDYAFGWSYGVGESMTLLVPSFYGGGSSQNYRGTKTHDAVFQNVMGSLSEQGQTGDAAVKIAEQQVASLFYWGNQPGVGVAIYFGAVLCFLFFLGCFLVDGSIKWWLLISTLFTLSISWGNNFFLNDLLFKYFPFFNKFRAVSMALGLSQFFMIILGLYGLQNLMNHSIDAAQKRRSLLFAGAITGGLVLIALILSGGMSYSGPNDTRFGADILEMVKSDRKSLLRADAIRSILFIGSGFTLIWFYLNGKIKANYLVLSIGLIAILDVFLIDKRIIFSEKFTTKEQHAQVAVPTDVDKKIMADKDPHFRVLDLRGGNPFSNANTSYFHKSLGGYHAAKLMRYQEVIEKYLSNPAKYVNVVALLNTKYIIQGEGDQGQAIPVPNPAGNAWFVPKTKIVQNADEELDALGTIEAGSFALIQKRDENLVSKLPESTDTNATIKLTKYHPDEMTYSYNSATSQLAVFSEIYYPAEKGWKMYLDGKPFDNFFKADYFLRGLMVPSGQHELKMEFKPTSFYEGEKISTVSSLLIMVLSIFGLIWHFWKEGLADTTQLSEIVITENKAKKAPTKKK